MEQMELWNLEEATKRHAAITKAEKLRVMGWLRRNTNLTDEAITEHVLKPVSLVVYEAGYEIGTVATAIKATSILQKASLYRFGFLVLSAAMAAWWLWKYLEFTISS